MAILSKKAVNEETTYLQNTQMVGAMLGGSMHIIYVIIFAICKVDSLLWFNVFISLPVFTAAFLCSYKGLLKIPPVIGTIEVTIHQVMAVLLLGQESGFLILLFCLVPIGILFYNWKVSFFINSMIALVLFLLISWFDTGQFVRYDLPATTLKIIRLINSIGLFAIVGLIIFYYITLNKKLYGRQKSTSQALAQSNEELNATIEIVNKQKDQIESQHRVVLEQHRNITDSIRYAERIQSAVLPPDDYLSEFLRDYFILFKPRDIVSGDFLWATNQDSTLMLAVADCTGHGVPGALLSMLGISFLNEIVNTRETLHANQILERLRDYVISSLHQTGRKGEAQDGIEIALCVINPGKNIMEYSGANRPLYIIRDMGTHGMDKDAQQGYMLMHISADTMPIGIYEQEPIPFTNNEIKLQKNDTVYLFSDGYLDQMGGPGRKTFRSHRFRNLLLEIQDQPMKMQKRMLTTKLEQWQGNVEQIDDILVVGFRL
jgi:serine phosphatase RsbU (regulator of sigma subunit)